jgi:hypothetical protein
MLQAVGVPIEDLAEEQKEIDSRDYEGANQLADLGADAAAEKKLGIKIDRPTPEQVSGVASEQPDQQLPDDEQDSSTGANGPGSGQ